MENHDKDDQRPTMDELLRLGQEWAASGHPNHPFKPFTHDHTRCRECGAFQSGFQHS